MRWNLNLNQTSFMLITNTLIKYHLFVINMLQGSCDIPRIYKRRVLQIVISNAIAQKSKQRNPSVKSCEIQSTMLRENDNVNIFAAKTEMQSRNWRCSMIISPNGTQR